MISMGCEMENFINITDSALNFIRSSIAENKSLGVRIDIKSGGCRGMTYSLDFVEEINKADLALDYGDVKIYVVPKAVVFIQNMTMDYIKNPMGGSIVFENPNAKLKCGCGKSFCIDDDGEVCDAGCGS